MIEAPADPSADGRTHDHLRRVLSARSPTHLRELGDDLVVAGVDEVGELDLRNGDEPTVYRNPAEVTAWEANDPIERWRRDLVKRGLWTQSVHDQYAKEITDEMMEALKHAEHVGAPPVESMFDDVFAETPAHLKEQREYLMQFPRAQGGH